MAVPLPDDAIVGHRIAVDQQFRGQLAESRFSAAEWDIIMSVVSFGIAQPESPSQATLTPIIDDLEMAVDAAEDMQEARFDPTAPPDDSSGVLDRLTSIFEGGQSTAGYGDRYQDAERLVNSYTDQLESHLREESAWDDLCDRVASD